MTWVTCSGGSTARWCPAWPGWPPRFRPLGARLRFALFLAAARGESDEGGREELEESWPSRARNSRTSPSSSATRASPAALPAQRRVLLQHGTVLLTQSIELLCQ